MRHRLRRQPAKLQAAEINKWNRWTDALQAGRIGQQIPNAQQYNPNSRAVFCKNISGSDRAQFEMMSISGMAWELETDGSTGLVFQLDTADPDEPPAVLVTPIANGETGVAVVDGLCLALVGAGSGLTGIADATNHRIDPDPDGPIRLLIAPNASATKLLPVVLGSTGITDLRLSGNNLQYKKNGTWTTWHTATTCS